MKKDTQKQSWNNDFVDFMQDKKKPKDLEPIKEEGAEAEAEKKVVEVVEDSKTTEMQRLYVMNLSYEVKEEELRPLFEPFGEVEQVEIPLRRGGVGTGFAFINFKETEAAVAAFAQVDKIFFQGRKVHILPAT